LNFLLLLLRQAKMIDSCVKIPQLHYPLRALVLRRQIIPSPGGCDAVMEFVPSSFWLARPRLESSFRKEHPN
jgi:hypothetical protein